MSSIKDIAQYAEVSKSTVSNVLSGKKYVSPSVKDKVLAACRILDYTPNYFASNIINNNSNIIGLFLEMGNKNYYPFYNELIKSTIIDAYEYGLQVLPYFSPDENEILNSLKEKRSPLKAAILLSPTLSDKRMLYLNENKIPFIVIGSVDEKDKPIYHVDVDNYKMVTELMQYIYNRGHRNILITNSNPELTITKYREKAIRDFAKNNKEMKIYEQYCRNEREQADTMLKENLSRYTDITCIVAYSDIIAESVYSWSAINGKTVGRDISVVAMGGLRQNNFQDKKLTMFYQDYEKIGIGCIKMLINLLNKKTIDTYYEIGYEFIEGNSIAKI